MKIAEIINEGASMSDLDEFTKELIEKYDLKSLSLFMNRSGMLELGMIAVDKSKQGSGIGTSVMNDITQFADRNNLTVVLSPAVKDPNFGTTSQSRLIKFYKRFDFVQNKGKNKDYSISRSMYRTPR